MPTKQFTNVLDGISRLNYTELKRADKALQEQLSRDQMGKIIAEREATIDSCPYCRHEKLIRWGSSRQGKQRFKCKSCLKTFNALAATPLHKIKKPQTLIAFDKLMNLGISLRDCADLLGVDHKTCFYWRHKLLKNPEVNKPVELLSIVEADEAFIAENQKGSRKLIRPPRVRGGGKKKIPILMALDRQGAVTHSVLKRNTKAEIEAALAPVLVPSSILITDGNLSYREIVKALPFPIQHKRMVPDKGKKAKVDGVYSIQRLNGFIARWRTFMRRFRGVATHYRDRYIAWFRCLEAERENQFWIKEATRLARLQ